MLIQFFKLCNVSSTLLYSGVHLCHLNFVDALEIIPHIQFGHTEKQTNKQTNKSSTKAKYMYLVIMLELPLYKKQ